MPTVTVEYYGVTGTGKNVTEAKRDAGEQIRKALEGDYTPSLIHWRQYTVLMARDPNHGWGYRISHPDLAETPRERMWLSYQRGDAEECLLALVRHIADIARPTGENPEKSMPFFAILPQREQGKAYRDFADTCRRNDQFQRRHAYAITGGMPTGDAHAFAGMDPSRHDLWKGTEAMFAVPEWEARP